MSIDWAALAGTAAVSIGITLTVVVLFATGVAALSRRAAGGAAAFAPTAVATASFTACAAAVAYGLYLIAFG
jgi:hypothetical protein